MTRDAGGRDAWPPCSSQLLQNAGVFSGRNAAVWLAEPYSVCTVYIGLHDKEETYPRAGVACVPSCQLQKRYRSGLISIGVRLCGHGRVLTAA